MRLDVECVRNVLFTVEEHTNGIDKFNLSAANYRNYHLLKDYDFIKVYYHIKQLVNGGFISEAAILETDHVLIIDLTWEGHQFIENIRSDNIWNKVKQAAKSAGSYAVSILVQTAAQAVLHAAMGALLPNQ